LARRLIKPGSLYAPDPTVARRLVPLTPVDFFFVTILRSPQNPHFYCKTE